MSSLDTIVDVNITASASAPTRKDFGVPLALAYHTHNTDLVRVYNDLNGLVADGFSTSEAAYLMAQAICEQNPRPPKFLIGRLTTAVAQHFTFVVTDNTNGHKVGFSILDDSGVTHDLYTTVSSQTTAQVATALAVVIAAVSGVASSVAVGTTITTILTTAGKTWYPSLIPNDETTFVGGFQGGTFTDTTGDANTEDDLAAITLVNPGFYGVATQLIDSTNLANTAAWCEANNRIYGFNSADAANLTANTGVFHTLKLLSYKYSFGLFSQSPGQFSALGLMAGRFTVTPGTDTWAFKTITGATPDDNLTPTQLTNIQTNNGNYYTTIAGEEVVTDGRSVQGQYMDIQRGIDALKDDMQKSVFFVLVSNQKVPYTTAGITTIATAVRASLKRFTATPASPNLFLSNDAGFQPIVTVPDIADISELDKADRVLKNVAFSATTTGAIQNVTINGTLSF